MTYSLACTRVSTGHTSEGNAIDSPSIYIITVCKWNICQTFTHTQNQPVFTKTWTRVEES